MSFMGDLARTGTFGLAGLALGHKKKKPPPLAAPQPSMISSIPLERPTSMIGPSRGGY